MDFYTVLNPSDLPRSKTLNQTNKKTQSTSSQHTPEFRGRVISLKTSNHYTIVPDARCDQYPDNGGDPSIRKEAATFWAQILLCHAPQYAELDVKQHGHKPAIMDIILELMSSVQHNEDTLMDEIERHRRLNRSHCEYGRVFEAEESLYVYWVHQAHIAAIRPDVSVPRPKFDISAERSTAGWIATLEGDIVDYEHPST